MEDEPNLSQLSGFEFSDDHARFLPHFSPRPVPWVSLKSSMTRDAIMFTVGAMVGGAIMFGIAMVVA